MAVGIWHRLDQTGRNILPFGITVLMMLVAMSPVQLPGWSTVAPPLTLVCVFYWAIHRPDLLRPLAVFLVGVLQDLLSGAPVGMSALLFMLTYWVVLTQRRFFLGHSFAMLWFGFAMVAVGAGLLQWVAYALIHTVLLDPRPGLYQGLISIALFPAPAWVLMRLHRAFVNDEEG